MKIPDQTSLPLAQLSAKEKTLLNGLWIDSAEELVAFATALEAGSPGLLSGSGLSACVTAAENALKYTLKARVRELRPGGSLGLRIDEQSVEVLQQFGRLRPVSGKPSSAFTQTLPLAVRLMDRMQPVRDQGQRGSCVAFATVALREFLAGDGRDLSEQFMYWACKELDGHPGPGSYIHTGMTALATYGLCLEEEWPYNPNPVANNEGQGPPPPRARQRAEAYRLASSRTVEPGLVAHYKHILAGGGGGMGMPITFGTLVFKSWYMSSETHRTGKITLPFPGEKHVGGHAWCIVGYVDDDLVPGGGYFIVRNSWGADWAYQSPEKPGHALMPYAYVEAYAAEAFTGPEASAGVRVGSIPSDSFAGEFVYALKTEESDLQGKLRRAGLQVIASPRSPRRFLEYTFENRQRFIANGFCWPPESPVGERLRDGWEKTAVPAAREAFFAVIEENLNSAKGMRVPDFKPRWWLAFLPRALRLSRIQRLDVSSLSEDLARRFSPVNVGGGERDLASAWWEEWRKVNPIGIYSLDCLAGSVNVVIAWMTPLVWDPELGLKPSPLDRLYLGALRETVSQWLIDRKQAASLTFFTVAAAGNPTEGVTGQSGDGYYLCLSTPHGDNNFKVSLPSLAASNPNFNNFLDLLKPETRRQSVVLVKEAVANLFADGFRGTCSVTKMMKETGKSAAIVIEALAELQESGQYLLQFEDNILFIMRNNPGGREQKGDNSAMVSKYLRKCSKRGCFGY